MEEVLKKLMTVKKGSFVDIGVDVGQTLLKVKSIEPAVPYYGFEPNPTCIYYLNQLIEANKISNVLLFPVAISDKAQIAQLNFYYDSNTDSAASMIRDFRPAEQIRKTVFIPCFSFDDVKAFIDLASVSIIKVDVEGAELEVLKGIRVFMEGSRPFIIMEILPVYKTENKARLDRQSEIEAILTAHGYRILRIKKEKDQLSSLELINAIGIHSNQDGCDYVFCPQELLQSLI